MEQLEQRQLFSVVTWDGAGSNNNWSTAANWVGGVAPVSGDSLTFSGSTRTTPNNDYAAGSSFGSIEFASTGFTLTGNQVSLSGGITVDSSVSAAAISLPIALASSQSINVASGTLAESGAITGSAAITKLGAGTLALSGSNAYTGGTVVSNGTVNVYGNQSGATGGWNIGSSATSTPVTVAFELGSTVNVSSGSSIQIAQTATTASAAIFNVYGSVINNGTLSVGRDAALGISSSGSWVQTGSMAVAPAANTSYNASIAVNTGGTFNYAGSSAIAINPATGGGSGNGLVSVAGGTFITGESFSDTNGYSAGSAILQLSGGGTLQLSANVALIATSIGSSFTVNLASGTANFNTSGFTGTVSQPIFGSGSLNKTGAGVLQLVPSNGYTGATTISGGTLTASGTGVVGAVTANPTGTFNDTSIAGATWTDSDIGSPSVAGSTTFNTANTYTVDGSGSDIAGNSDQLNFASQPFSGDGGITAEVNGTDVNTDSSATTGSKDGIMFRDNLLPDSPFVEVGYTRGSGIQMLYRNGNGATVTVGGTASSVSGAVWLRLTRVQGAYTASYSTDGVVFNTVGTDSTDNIEENALVGLAVSSHDNTKLASATFSNVAITNAVAVSTTEIDLSFTVPWMSTSDTLIYANESGSSVLLADVAAGTSTVALTSLPADAAYSFDLASGNAVVTAGGTRTGNAQPILNSAAATFAPSSTNVTLWQVTVDSSLSKGIAAQSDSGSVSCAHEYVYAGNAMEAAEDAGISVVSSGPPLSMEITEAGNTGNTAPSYEESLASLLGIAGSTPIVACEDGIDGDFNDAYAQITIVEV